MNDTKANISALVDQAIKDNELILESLESSEIIHQWRLNAFYNHCLNKFKDIWQATHTNDTEQTFGYGMSWDDLLETLEIDKKADIKRDRLVPYMCLVTMIDLFYRTDRSLNQDERDLLCHQISRYKTLCQGNNIHPGNPIIPIDDPAPEGIIINNRTRRLENAARNYKEGVNNFPSQ